MVQHRLEDFMYVSDYVEKRGSVKAAHSENLLTARRKNAKHWSKNRKT